ncbi:MAG: hypothetical protein RIC55_11460 [Pirellulaceae bacterium]
MCIFSQPVVAVNNTQIFARATSRRTQLLVYQMNYESSDVNAMILPIPIRQPAREGSLRFIDLRDYGDFFADLADGFPFTPPFSIGCSASFDPAAGNALEVFEVGNYVASFAPKLSDLSRLDERFTLPNKVWSQIPQYATYGFAVFQLAAGSLTPHPMAFEFECGDGSIYFPTMHIHDGQIHDAEQFDHVLYLQHAGFDSRVYAYQNSDVADRSTGLIRSKDVAWKFCKIGRAGGVVDGDLLVHRKIMRGVHPNRDVDIETFGDPARPTLNLQSWTSYAPWLVVGAAVAWFFARRARVKRAKAAADADKQPPEDRDGQGD